MILQQLQTMYPSNNENGTLLAKYERYNCIYAVNYTLLLFTNNDEFQDLKQ